jgi:hypothetical protein
LDRELTRFLLWLQVLSAPSMEHSANPPGRMATSTSFPSRGDEPERSPLVGSFGTRFAGLLAGLDKDKSQLAAIIVAFRSSAVNKWSRRCTEQRTSLRVSGGIAVNYLSISLSSFRS